MEKQKYPVYLNYTGFFICILLTQYIFGRLVDVNVAFFSKTMWWHIITSSVLLGIPALTNRKAFILVVFILFDILLYVNVLYYRNYLSLIPLNAFNVNPGDMLTLQASVVNSMRFYDILLFLPLIILVVVNFIFRKKLRTGKRQFLYAGLINIGIAAIILLIILVSQRNKPENFSYDFNVNTWDKQRNLLSKYGYWIYFAREASNDQTIELTDAQKQEIEHFLKSKNTVQNIIHADTVPSDKNIILILVESLETFPIGKTVEGHEIMPFVNSLVNDSLTYFVPHVATQTSFGRSSDGQLMINTGMLPIREGVTCNINSRIYHSLATGLKSSGKAKQCVTFHPCKPTFWNQAMFSDMQGYDKTYGAETWDNSDILGPFLSDSALITQATPIITSLSQPFFVQLITGSSHDFIDFGHRKSFSISDAYDYQVARYLEIINYVDRQIELLFKKLEENNLLDNSTIIIVGDHNIFMTEPRSLIAANDPSWELLGDYSFIPLIVYNGEKTGQYDAVIGQVDVYSTLLDLLDIQSGWRGLGNSVFDSVPPVSAVTSRMEIIGDSTAMVQQQKKAWEISDIMIRGNFFKDSSFSE